MHDRVRVGFLDIFEAVASLFPRSAKVEPLPSLADNYSPRSSCDAERKKRNSSADLFRR